MSAAAAHDLFYLAQVVGFPTSLDFNLLTGGVHSLDLEAVLDLLRADQVIASSQQILAGPHLHELAANFSVTPALARSIEGLLSAVMPLGAAGLAKAAELHFRRRSERHLTRYRRKPGGTE